MQLRCRTGGRTDPVEPRLSQGLPPGSAPAWRHRGAPRAGERRRAPAARPHGESASRRRRGAEPAPPAGAGALPPAGPAGQAARGGRGGPPEGRRRRRQPAQVLPGTRPPVSSGRPVRPPPLPPPQVVTVMSIPVRFAVALLRSYKRWLSPLLPRACRFSPTCSEYGQIALRSHGLVAGSWLTVRRLLRCQPLGRGGIDLPPVGVAFRKLPGLRAEADG